jgi:hypothetical protein
MRDQTMLRLMRRSDRDQVPTLVNEILASEAAAGIFEYFADEAIKPLLLPVLSNVHSELRRRYGVTADLKHNEGVFCVWRVARATFDWGTIEPWLVDELLKCIPGYLRLLNSIYYFWLATEMRTREQREPVRRAVLDACKTRLTAADDNALCNSFDPSFPYVLFHLVFTTDFQQPDVVPYGSASDWAWLGQRLLRAVGACPATIIPQLIIAMNDFETRRRTAIAYRFNDELLREWFGARASEFVEIVRGFEPDDAQQMDVNAVGYIRAAKADAERRLPTTS